ETNYGVLNVSLTWHAQAHEASLTWGFAYRPVQQWLHDSKTSFKLVNALLTAVHPKLHRHSSAVHKQLLVDEEITDLHELIKAWPMVFATISVVHNRETPFHHDSKPAPQWYNLFLSVGSYTNVILELLALGIHAHYIPGMAALFSGLLLRHGMSTVDQGDPISYVFHMWPSIFHFALIPLGKWATYSSLCRGRGSRAVGTVCCVHWLPLS
ncbi:hypothetical protein PAXRUDRAFT_137663, partial [Paxillus rubicundulus Ve08.2h10]